MLVAAAVPFVVAHNDTGAPTLLTDNVYGTYNGPSGVAVVNAPEVGTTSAGVASCDWEIQSAGDPTGASGTVTEGQVDGTAAKSSNTFTTPDGTVDDGGTGGVCHWFDQWANSNWNTPGCPTGEVLGQDNILPSPMDQVFAFAWCDWEISTIEGVPLCVFNAVTSREVDEIVNECSHRLQPGSPNPGQHIACGTDNVGDTATAGYLDPTAGFGAPGVPSNPFGCDSSTAAQSVLVFASADGGNGQTSTPTRGWVGISGSSGTGGGGSDGFGGSGGN